MGVLLHQNAGPGIARCRMTKAPYRHPDLSRPIPAAAASSPSLRCSQRLCGELNASPTRTDQPAHQFRRDPSSGSICEATQSHPPAPSQSHSSAPNGVRPSSAFSRVASCPCLLVFSAFSSAPPRLRVGVDLLQSTDQQLPLINQLRRQMIMYINKQFLLIDYFTPPSPRIERL